MRAQYTFASPRLAMHSITEADTAALVAWRSDPATIRYFYNPTPVTAASHLAWYQNHYLPDEHRVDFVAEQAGVPVGFFALTDMDFAAQSCEINYTLGAAAARGQGLASEGVLALLAFGHRQFGLRHFTAEVHTENEASQRLALRCGFEKTGQNPPFLIFTREFEGENT